MFGCRYEELFLLNYLPGFSFGVFVITGGWWFLGFIWLTFVITSWISDELFSVFKNICVPPQIAPCPPAPAILLLSLRTKQCLENLSHLTVVLQVFFFFCIFHIPFVCNLSSVDYLIVHCPTLLLNVLFKQSICFLFNMLLSI